MPIIEVRFKLEKETKGALRYQEVDEKGEVIGPGRRFSFASCSNLVSLARFFSQYCGGVLGLFHVVFSIILAGRFFGQPPESIRFFECSFCCLATLLLRRVFGRHLKVLALRFHGHGFVSGLFGCCRIFAATALRPCRSTS
jgi:hypothetical protein